MKKPLSKSLKAFYGVGDFGFTLMTNVELFLFAFFLTDIAKFDLVTVGIIMTVTSTIDMILSPFNGAVISGTKAMKWGRYRSWLLLMPPIVVVAYTFQFTNIGTGMLPVIIIIIGSVISHIAWNFAYVANLSLIPVLSSNPADRAQLSATRGAYNQASKIVYSYIGAAGAVWIGTQLNNPTLGYTLIALGTGILFWALYGVHFKMSKGYEPTGAEAAALPKEKQDRVSIKELAQSLFQNRHLLVLLLADLARWTVNFVMASSGIYFFIYVMGNMALFFQYLLFANIMGMIGAFTSKYAAKKLSTRTSAIIGFIGLPLFLFIAKFALGSVVGTMIFLCVAQYFLGFIYSLIVAMYSDSVVYSEWKTGKSAAGWIMGLLNLPLKIANVIKGAALPVALAAAGYVAGTTEVTEKLVDGITNIFITIPAIGMVIGAVLLIVGYGLTQAKVDQYQKEIDERKAAQTE